MPNEDDAWCREQPHGKLRGLFTGQLAARGRKRAYNRSIKAQLELTEKPLRSRFRKSLTEFAVMCVVLPLCSLSALAQTAGDVSSPLADKTTQQAIHDYILAHPEVLIESLRRAKRQVEQRLAVSQKQKIDTFQKDLTGDPNAPVFGNPNGDVTLVEFFDYRCPYCRRMEPLLRALIRDDPGLRIVQKEFPILGPASVYAARVALSAQKRGKHVQLFDALMAKKANIDEATILKTAGEVGLDVDQIRTDMNSPEVETEIQRTLQIAQALGLNGTPAFIIGTELLPGATDFATLKSMIDDARRSHN